MDYQQLLKESDEEHKKKYTRDIHVPDKEDSRKNGLSIRDLRFQYSKMKSLEVQSNIVPEINIIQTNMDSPSTTMPTIETSDMEKHNYIFVPKKEVHIPTVQSKYVSTFSKQILYVCIHNRDKEIITNYTYEQLLSDMYIIFQSQTYNQTPISIYSLSNKYKLLFILYSIIYNQSIYIQYDKNNEDNESNTKNIIELTDMDIINIKDCWLENNTIPEHIETIYNDLLQKEYVHITGKLIYYNHLKQKQTDWENICLFTNECIRQYKPILDKKQSIHIPLLNEIYFIYFIPIAIILNKTILWNTQEDTDISSILTIGDHTAKTNKNILIMNKYSNVINIYYDNSLFFNYTINQFIIHSIKLKNDYMLGKLCTYISIRNNILYYKQYMLQLPKSYVLKQNILYIKKKYKTKIPYEIETNIHPYDKINFKNKSKRLLSITIKQDIGHILTNKICNRIYTYILLKFPICTQYIEYSNLENIYLFNNEDINDEFINNSLFSMNFLIKKNKIVISYAECIHNHIQYILLELNNILHTKKINVFVDNHIAEYILGHSKHLQYIISDITPNKMNIVEFLKTFGFCTIKTLHLYYYKYHNSLWSKKDIQNVINMSNRIKTNPKSLKFGNHILIEMELDIGINIIMERTKQLVFYVKEHAMNRFKEKK